VVNDESPSFEVTAPEAGRRLDQLVREHFPTLTRRILNEMFARGAVTANDRVVAKGDRTAAGARVRVRLPEPDRAIPNPGLPISIVAEGRGWVVVDKPAGMPSAARDGRDCDSVANALVARYPAMVEFGHHPREAGLVHRLDTATSGLLLAATDGASFDELSKALRSGHLHKRYLALAVGTLHDQGYVLSRIAAGRGGRVLTTDLSPSPAPRSEGRGGSGSHRAWCRPFLLSAHPPA
jgi:23S rRNA pseudouridine1911/1915/1917 synthase